MKQRPCIERRGGGRRQRGDALFEALIGIVLAAVLGLGLSYAAGRMLNSQRYASTQGIAVNQMRAALAERGLAGLCNGTQSAQLVITPTGGQSSTVTLAQPQCSRAAVTVGVASTTALNVTLPASSTGVVTGMQLSTPASDIAAQSLLGAGVLTISQ